MRSEKARCSVVEPWSVVGSEALVANRWLTVRHDVCRIVGSEWPIDYYVVEKSDFAMAVALTTDRHLILVRCQGNYFNTDIFRVFP